MHLAVGTSLIAISLNALWGLVGNLRFGTLDWTLTLLFASGGAAGVVVGGRLGRSVPDRTLMGIGVYTFGRSAPMLIPLLGIN